MDERERERAMLLASFALLFSHLSFLTFDSEDLITLASLLLTLAAGFQLSSSPEEERERERES